MTETAAADLDALQAATRRHRESHGCNAYTFEDGPGLLALAQDNAALRILELGTAIGHTACVLASATPRTRVDTIEGDPLHVSLARHHVGSLGLADRVTVHEGDFMAVMAGFEGPYDLAFFDGLGPTRQIVGRLGRLLRPGGLLVCSNLRWMDSGERRLLMDELGRATHWSAAGSIESGATGVFRRAAPASA
jgi:predicted O-methyltransferase YrrM